MTWTCTYCGQPNLMSYIVCSRCGRPRPSNTYYKKIIYIYK